MYGQSLRWLVIVVACGVIVAGCGDDGGGSVVDGGPGVDAVDAPASVASTLYLNFEGVTISPSPGVDDAAANRSSIVNATFVVPPFRNGAATRDAEIAAIAGAVREILAPYNLTVVTVRPLAGPYDMIVMANASTEVGLPQDIVSIGPHDCPNMNRSNVAFVFGDSLGNESLATAAVGGVGISNGIPTTTKPGDCMCYAGPCPIQATRCTIGGPGTPVQATCASGAAEIDVDAVFRQVFGAAP